MTSGSAIPMVNEVGGALAGARPRYSRSGRPAACAARSCARTSIAQQAAPPRGNWIERRRSRSPRSPGSSGRSSSPVRMSRSTDSGVSPKNASGTPSPRATRSPSRSSTRTTRFVVCVAREIAKGTARCSSTVRTSAFTPGRPRAAHERCGRRPRRLRGADPRPRARSRSRPPGSPYARAPRRASRC